MKVGLLVAGTKVRADTMLTQLKAKSKTFAQLVGDQKNSSDPASKSSTVDVPEFPADSLGKNLGPILGPPAQKLGAGGFTPVVALGKDAFGIVSILSKTPATKADFEKLKVQAETDYKMEQVARQELAKNQKGQTLEKVIPQIEEAIMRQGQQQGNFAKPTYRELLGVLTQGKVQELQTRLRNEAKVTITDNDLKSVADKFKPSPTPVASSTANTATSNTANAAVSPAKP